MLRRLTDKLRTGVHAALTSNAGAGLRPVAVARELFGTANDLVGRPFCSKEELDERRKLIAPAEPPAVRRAPAPVMVYFDGKDQRTLKKLEELLGAKEIPFSRLDVSEDEATRSWAETEAQGKEFPLVFIASELVGGLEELTQLDVSGELARRVFGGDG